MKVLNLRCAHDHRFEGWFSSHEELESQQSRGLIECPVCGDHQIERLPTAPRLNVLALREPKASAATPPSSTAVAAPDDAMRARLEQVQAAYLQAVRHVLDSTEDVGERFPEEARRIHYGESQQRGIRGKASPEDAESLREEGIEVMSLRVPAALKGPVQ